jgi:segregation and condensation protein A
VLSWDYLNVFLKKDIPETLYIPPDALEVYLERFEGPLDFLLYLIKKDDLDILEISFLSISQQYLNYIHEMKQLKIELAAEYLAMAAWLAEIKTRFLLPKLPSDNTEDETDPHTLLIERLQEYAQMRKAVDHCALLPQEGRDFWLSTTQEALGPVKQAVPPVLTLETLKDLFQKILKRALLKAHHAIRQEPLRVRDRVKAILKGLLAASLLSFKALFLPEEGRRGVVVSFLAVLQLLKNKTIEIIPSDGNDLFSIKKGEHYE